MERIALIGLGAMGSRMGQRLLDAGYPLRVHNRTRSRAQALLDAGAAWADSPREAAEGADVVTTMVTDDEAARAVWLDPERGALAGLSAGAVALEVSTLSPGFIDMLGARVDERGATLLDAPVAGSRPQAEAGALVFFVGGPRAALERVRPLLDVVGGAVHHMGPRAHGTRMKLAVNTFFAVQVAALGEVLALAESSGLSRARAMEVLGSLPITSPALRGVGGLVVAERWQPLFPVDLVHKDLRYAIAAFAGDLPTADAARASYAEASRRGLGGENLHAVAKLHLSAAEG